MAKLPPPLSIPDPHPSCGGMLPNKPPPPPPHPCLRNRCTPRPLLFYHQRLQRAGTSQVTNQSTHELCSQLACMSSLQLFVVAQCWLFVFTFLGATDQTAAVIDPAPAVMTAGFLRRSWVTFQSMMQLCHTFVQISRYHSSIVSEMLLLLLLFLLLTCSSSCCLSCCNCCGSCC